MSRPATTRSRTCTSRPPSVSSASWCRNTSGFGGLRTWSRSAWSSRRRASRLRRDERALDLGALGLVDELVVVGRTPVVRDLRRADLGGGPQPVQLLLLVGVRLSPTAGGRPRGRRRSRSSRHRTADRPARRSRTPSGRGRPGRCRRRRAAPGRGWRAARPRAGRGGTGSAPRWRRRRGGWSARRAAGRPAGWSSPSRSPAACAARPRASRPRGSGSRTPRPSSWAATSARRSASQASWSTACSSAAAYAAWPTSSSRWAGELLDAPDGVAQRPQRRRQHLADGAVVAERRLLAEQHQVGRRLDRAGDAGTVRQAARDRAQQGRLAGAVLADQPDPPAGLGDQVDPGQRGAVAERDGDVAERRRVGRADMGGS